MFLGCDHKVTFIQHYLVKFKIRGYHDEVLCDIIPIDTCHMFLGRLGEFDNYFAHDDHLTTNYLIKDGVRHKLKVLNEIEDKVYITTKICCVDGRKFLEGIRHENVFFKYNSNIW